MSGLTHILNESAAHPQARGGEGGGASDSGGGDGSEPDLWIGVPPGFLALPLEDPASRIAEAGQVLAQFVPEESRALFEATLGSLELLLAELAVRRTVYCGIGFHTAEGGEQIGSSLVASLHAFPEKRNPRLVIRDMVTAQDKSGEPGHVELIDLDNGPAMFVEAVRELPTPQLPGGPAVPDGATSKVYQLRALVPSADGTKLAALEFSTPRVEHGIQFRTMMALMAATVAFEPPAGSGGEGTVSKRISDILGG